MAAALLIIAISQSCKHNHFEYDDLSWVDTTLGGALAGGDGDGEIVIIEKPSPTVQEAGIQTHVIFKTNEPWKITVDPKAQNWMSVKPDNGKDGKSTAMIYIDPNKAYDERNGAFTIAAGNARKTITLTQKQTDAIIATTSKIEVEAEGGVIEVELKANVEYMQDIEKNARGWILPATSKALSAKIMRYTIAENQSTAPRQGKIQYLGNNAGETVIVYQKGTSEALVLSNTHYHLPQEGGEIKVEVISNSQFNIKEPGVDWLRRNIDKNQSSYTLFYSVAENKETKPRNCYIVISSHDLSQKDTIFISQDLFTEQLKVTSDHELQMDNSATDITVSVESNTGYTISMPEWIKGPAEAPEGSNEHKFAISANPNYDSRTGKITFTNLSGSVTDEVSIIQTKKVDGLTIVSYPTEILQQEASSYQVALKASERWVVTVEEGCRTWLLTEPASGEKDETYFYLKTTTNNTYDDRTGSISIKSGQIVKTLLFTQEGQESILEIKEGEEGVAIPFTGGEATITVYSNVEYKVEYPAWASCKNPAGAPGTNKHVIYVPENETLTDLDGEIKISTLNGKKTIQVPIVQDKHTALLEIRNVNKYVLETTGGDALIQFITNNDWTATVSENARGWMYLNPRYGGQAGKTDLVVTAMINEAFEDREGTVTITAGPKQKELTFRQPASEPTIRVINNMPVESVYGGMTLIAKVNANVDYTIDLPDWISGPRSGSKTSPQETATLRFTIKENPYYEDREYHIKLSNSEFGASDEIVVKQDKKVDEIKAFVNKLSFPSKASFSAFDLNASDNWTAEVSEDWIRLSESSGSRGKTSLEVKVTEFDGIDPRSGYITFTCGKATTQVEVTQAPVDAFIDIVSGQSQVSDYMGKDFEVEVSTNTDFSIELPDWITGPLEGKAGESTLKFTILRNNDYSKRTGSITLYNTGHNANNKVTVTQDLKVDVVTMIDEPQMIIPAEGQTVTIKFQASDSWSIYCQDYVEPSPKNGPAGENTVDLEIGPNPAIYGRTVVVQIICGKTKKLVEISQSKKKQ